MINLKKQPFGYYVILLQIISFFFISVYTDHLNKYMLHVALSIDSFTFPSSLILNFLMHNGTIHLALNLFLVYQLAELIEREYNKLTQVFIYFFSGILISAICSLWLIYTKDQSNAIGYSGVCFFLIGMIVRFMPINNIIINVVLMGAFHFAVIHFKIPVFWQAHLVGFVLGLIFSYALLILKKHNIIKKK